MDFVNFSSLRTLFGRGLISSFLLSLFSLPALAQVIITSPTAASTTISAVRITASATESSAFHLEVWDNGTKLGDVTANSVNDVYVLPNGSHTLTVNAVSNGGTVLNGSSVRYTVAERCTTSQSSALCAMDHLGVDNSRYCNSVPQVDLWVANACGSGIQGTGGNQPADTNIQAVTETGTIPDVGNTTLNGQSLHLSETQGGNGFSNVLFKADSPSADDPPANPVDSHWTLEAYVHLPNPLAHQAFEIDAQYTVNGVWTKFYTECQFNTGGVYNTDASTGYWAVFDTATGGWIVLNGKLQNNQTPPAIPCTREQFAQPWQYSASSNPSFSGWHHIMWNFLRRSDGTVTFQTLTFDGSTSQVNFTPNSATGGSVGSNVNFSALIQLDGADNSSKSYGTVDAYVNEVNVTHIP